MTVAEECVARSKRAAEFEKGLKSVMPKSIQTISKMSKFTGEIPNIIINAFGTGLIAPIFIKYNFLSKTDDDTRTYSALRQPISAVLSVVTSAAVVIPFNKLVDHMSKKGFFYNLENKAASFKYNKPTQKLEELVDSATKNHNIEYKSGEKKIVLPKEEISRLMEQAVDDGLKDVEGNLKRRETEKIGKQISRGEFYRNNKTQVQTTLAELKSKVASCSDDKEVSNYFDAKLKELKANKADKELLDIVEDISSRPDLETIKAKIEDIEATSKKFGKFKSLKRVAKEVTTVIEAENKLLRIEKANLDAMKAAIKKGESFKDVIKIANNLKGNTFVYDVIQKHMGNIEANLKGFKQVTGLAVSLAILPVACSMLNYIYPKFMDKFFPKLSDKKHAKTADTFVKSAPQPAVQTTAQATPVKTEQEVGK